MVHITHMHRLEAIDIAYAVVHIGSGPDQNLCDGGCLCQVIFPRASNV